MVSWGEASGGGGRPKISSGDIAPFVLTPEVAIKSPNDSVRVDFEYLHLDS